MSLKALSWAFETEVQSSTQKLVLLALCNFASETGKAYPTVETVCGITQAEDKAVRRALKSLTEQGLIVDTGKRTGATQQVRVYQLPNAACHSKIPQNGHLTHVEDPRKTPERPPKGTPKRVAEPGTGNREPKSLKRFSIPTFSEMELHASKIGLPPSEIEGFFAYHSSRGWKYKTGLPMVDWRQAMVTWRENAKKFANGHSRPQRQLFTP